MVPSSSSPPPPPPPEEYKPTSNHPNNHHRFLPPPPVVETCNDLGFGGFVQSKEMDSDSLGDLSGRSEVDKAEAVISRVLTKGEDSLGNLEKCFVEDDALRCRESEIPPPESKKEILLRDLECVGDASEGTSVPGMNEVVRGLWARNVGNEGFDLRRSLKIAVIDDTAVVEQVPTREFRGMVKKEIGEPSVPKKLKEIVDGEKGLGGEKARQARRKAKSLRGSEKIVGNKENKNGRKLMYSIKEMEALRFVNVVEQRRLWRRVYDGLGSAAKEYVSLLSSYDRNYQNTQPVSNFDCIWQPVILGSGRRSRRSKIAVPPNTMNTLYSMNWSYAYLA